MGDTKLSKSDFEKALKLLGTILPKPMKIWVVGGGALVLGHGLKGKTADLDCVLRVGNRPRLEEAISLVAIKYKLPEDWMNFKFEEFNYEINKITKSDFQFSRTFGSLTVCFASLELILATKCTDSRFRDEDFQYVKFCVENLGLKTLDEIFDVVESKDLIDTLNDDEARILETSLRSILARPISEVATAKNPIDSLPKLSAADVGAVLKKAVAEELKNLLNPGPNLTWMKCNSCSSYYKDNKALAEAETAKAAESEAKSENYYIKLRCNMCGRSNVEMITAPSKDFIISKVIGEVIKWAKNHYPKLGEGSSRVVYKLDDDHALKLAQSEAGTAQNKSESRLATKFHELPITKVHFIDPLGLFMVVDFAHELNEDHFEEKYKMPFVVFARLCNNLGNCKFIKDLKRKKQYAEGFFTQLSVEARDLVKDLMKHHIMVSDIDRKNQWGEVKDDPVLIDYGFTHHVWQTYYR